MKTLVLSAILAASSLATPRVSLATPLDDLMPRPVRVERGSGVLDVGSKRRDSASTLEDVRIVRRAVEGAPSDVADEAYELEIGEKGITIVAPGPRGERYARVTLEQLRRLSDGKLPQCRIVDWPALKWRGYMNDCGRNYLELRAVKAILDVMAQYKMNLFHWHLSDYHGWRLESKKYPQFQRREAFMRQVGRFYTQDEFREIVRYAAERGITVMPELDVPGHTLAFRRGLGIESMSAPGTERVVADLFEELCSLAPADVMPFVHLGTDEVRVAPERCDAAWLTMWAKTINACGRKVVVWAPGEKIDPSCDVIDMAWSDDHVTNAVNPVIDAARLYNGTWGTFDVLPHLAYTRACRSRADAKARQIGAITCTWHDDNVGDDTEKLFRECMVFPSIVGFADSFWSGRTKDEPSLQARLPAPSDPRFAAAAELERRMVAQRDKTLTDLAYPFPFLKQTDFRWRLTDGETGKVIATDVASGTLWIRHGKRLESAFVTNVTGHVVAETWIWSPRDVACGAWIDFIGASGAYGRLRQAKMPERGTWDNAGSTVSLNGELLPPPVWKQPGLTSTTPEINDQDVPWSTDLLEVPMADEMPTLRAPYPIRLRKGWNHVRLDVRKTDANGDHFWLATFAPLLGTSEHPREVSGLKYRSAPPK